MATPEQDSRLSRIFTEARLTLWRTTATDDALASELVKKLRRRRLVQRWPGRAPETLGRADRTAWS